MTPTQAKFNAARQAVATKLIERHDEVDIVFTALVCQEHPLLVGAPGTAKSLMLDSIMNWLGDAERFSILFNKFTTPEEVFGPLSVASLKKDKYVRITHGKLPQAVGAFGDEIFKASSAILNTLLRILNERTYDDGSGAKKCPLKIFVGASNEWPSEDGGKELNALFDRFLFRKKVKPITTPSGIERLLWENDLTPQFGSTINTAEIDEATREASQLPYSKHAKNAVHDTLNELRKEGVNPGDRRKRKAIGAVKAYAWLNGASEVLPDHLEILSHILWDDPNEQPEKCTQIVAKLANPAKAKITAVLVEAEEIVAKTDPTKLTEATTATAKLGNLLKDVQASNPAGTNAFAKQAEEYLKGKIYEIKLRSFGDLV